MGRGKEAKEEREEGREEGGMIRKTGSFKRTNQGQLDYHYQ